MCNAEIEIQKLRNRYAKLALLFLGLGRNRRKLKVDDRSGDGYHWIPLVLLTSEHPLLSILGQRRAEKTSQKVEAFRFGKKEV